MFVHAHHLNVYPSVLASSYILWNQILTPYAQDIHNFVQAPIE